MRNINKQFGDHRVLDQFWLTVDDNELLCIQGPTGSGKSTLLRIIAGLERPDEGEVFIGDEVVFSETEWVHPAKRGVSMVFQERALWPHLTVEKHLKLVANGRSCEPILARCKLESLRKQRVAKLSGGQQQQVAIARALMVDTPVLLLDEPLNHLDDSLRHCFMELLRAEHAAGKTIILTTHRGEEAKALATRITHMDAGNPS